MVKKLHTNLLKIKLVEYDIRQRDFTVSASQRLLWQINGFVANVVKKLHTEVLKIKLVGYDIRQRDFTASASQRLLWQISGLYQIIANIQPITQYR